MGQAESATDSFTQGLSLFLFDAYSPGQCYFSSSLPAASEFSDSSSCSHHVRPVITLSNGNVTPFSSSSPSSSAFLVTVSGGLSSNVLTKRRRAGERINHPPTPFPAGQSETDFAFWWVDAALLVPDPCPERWSCKAWTALTCIDHWNREKAKERETRQKEHLRKWKHQYTQQGARPWDQIQASRAYERKPSPSLPSNKSEF